MPADAPGPDVTPPPAPTPTLTREDLGSPMRPARASERGGGWALLAIVALLTGVLVAVVLHADIEAIADDGWRENALWATAAALVLLGLALASVAWTVATDAGASTLSRTAVLAAVIGVVGATIVVGLADEQGGELATSSTAPVAAATVADEPAADTPLQVEDALDPANLAPAALPIDVRTSVTIELTQTGRELFAAAMECRPRDFLDSGFIGTAIGGTWAQPLLIASPPFDVDGEPVGRCHRVVIRLPIAAGTVRPGF